MVRFFRKKSVIFAVVSWCIVSCIVAGNDEELFLRGNKYYAQGNYENALNAYDSICSKGYIVLYNMGNCFFHRDDYAQALVYWSRAQKGATPQMYQNIMQNKAIAFKKLGKQQPYTITDKLVKGVGFLSVYVSLLVLQIIFLIIWFVLMVLRRKKYSEMVRLKKITHISICFFMVIVGTILTVEYLYHDIGHAIVVKKEAKLLNGPDNAFQVISPLVYAEDVTIKEAREGWYKIQYADMLGWVEESVIKVI